MSKIPRVMAAMVAALTALLVAGAALAQPANPEHHFYGYAGDVTLDGNSVPGGTTINAQADGAIVASGVVATNGEWSIKVRADAGSVRFAIGDAVSSVAYPVASAGTTQVKLALTTPEPEPEVTEPEGGTEDDELGTEDDGTEMDDGSDGDELGTEDGGTEMDDGSDGDELGTEDDGTGDGTAMMDANGDGSEDDGDAMPDDGTDGDGMPAELLDEDPPTDEAMGTDGDDGTAMGTDGDAAGDDGSAMGTDEDADGDDGQMESDTGDTDTVGGVTGLGATGTGGLADSRSSAALWAGIGSALALLALLGGGFAVRRRAQSRS